MRRFMRSFRGILVIMSVPIGLLGCQATKAQFARETKTVRVELPEDAFSIRSRDVELDVSLLRGRTGDRVELQLFEGRSLKLVYDHRQEFGAGGFAWTGHEENEPNTTATFAVKGKTVVGNIRTLDGKHYQIRPVRDAVHRLAEIDPKRIPGDCATDPKAVKVREDPAADTCATDPPSDIDVLVVYTDDARAGAGSTAAMEATVFLAFAEANQSYLNSNVTQRIRLAYVDEVSYTETANSSTDLDRLEAKADGFLDNVHSLRDTHAADIVIMITETLEAGIAGRARIMGTVSNAFESSAFGVVKRTSATGNLSFAHELGHIMGARHDWGGDSTNNSPHAFNHGHHEPSPSDATVGAWRTLMARNSLSGSRVQFWSNPNIDFPIGASTTDPMGTATGPQQTDNHQTLNLTALTVANFRCSSPDAPNVWMKDAWNDTGVEPDPATAGQAMWKSPYIWVRNAQDTSRVHQHEHENPEFGATNFVYVKIHNGFNTTTSGDLEIYFADASTSLTWPTAWTLMGTVSVTNFEAHATQIVEQSWSPPATGHYCLVARWVSPADPMATAEGSSIGANVRANNNLVWRNVNVVDLSADESADVSLFVRNPLKVRARATIVIGGRKVDPRFSFLAHGRVEVRLDERLAKVWKQGGQMGTGFQQEGEGLLISPRGARLGEMALPPGFEGRMTIRLRRLKTTPRRVFELDIRHISGKMLVGGVSYEVRTEIR